jgi:glutathione synthase/RimK-type ligase-like ATP-grasp enzyme
MLRHQLDGRLFNEKPRMTREPDTVLIVTTSYDFAPDYVTPKLEARGVPHFRLNTDEFPMSVEARFDPEHGLEIRGRAGRIKGTRIKSVWYRRHVAPSLPPESDMGVREFCERESKAFMAGALSTLDTERWLSSPLAISRAEQKLYQLAFARKLGFRIPRTAAGNNAAAVRKLSSHGPIVAKAVHSGYITSESGNKGIFTSHVRKTDLEELDELHLAPVIFQEFIEKVSDIRVTVIGEELFAAEILSQTDESSRVDWRAADKPILEHRAHILPGNISVACKALVRGLGLHFGAIDLALDEDGGYTFFEINPNGEWVWLEDYLGFCISDSIAAWLDD